MARKGRRGATTFLGAGLATLPALAEPASRPVDGEEPAGGAPMTEDERSRVGRGSLAICALEPWRGQS
jgi:hypothetical protein